MICGIVGYWFGTADMYVRFANSPWFVLQILNLCCLGCWFGFYTPDICCFVRFWVVVIDEVY